MSTPVRLTDAPQPPPTYEPEPVSGPLGWLLMTAGATGMLLASWMLFGTEEAGMWAGYRDQGLAIVVLLAAMSLRSSLARVPALALGLLCGVGLILFGALMSDGLRIVIPEVVFGALIVIGTVLQGVNSRR